MNTHDMKKRIAALEAENKQLKKAKQIAHDALQVALHRLPYKPKFDDVAARIGAALIELRKL